MKQLLFSLFALIALCGCSGVDSDDRFIPVEGITPERTILIEDFTGQNCVNCPGAHEVLDQLVAQYPDNIIPVSIHAGHFGVAVERTRYPDYVGLMQPEGDGMASRWGITAFPMGVINRTGEALEVDAWATAVRDQLAIPSNLDIELTAALDGGNISITAILKPQADIKGTLHVWVIESGIVAFQRDTNTRIPDYVHNNVYRCSVNGIEGQGVDLTAHVHETVTMTQAVRDTETEKWNTANLDIVAFLETSSGVLQAAKAHVE
jgi:thiol-disulfide isomerase/thioredoxin